MGFKQRSQQVVFTNQARCRDCYRCVRICPVKAIVVKDGQAFIDEERCLSCGTCIRECPQGAKTYRMDLDKAEEIVSQPFAAVSIAPSFAGIFEPWQYTRLPAALRRLGFRYVAETAVGASIVAAQMSEYLKCNPKQACICTACPAVVTYVEKYRPDDIGCLMPIVSPMIAHAMHIKKHFNEKARVVFIGPCVAKKVEAERIQFAGLVDCVLTFEELEEWFKKKNIDLNTCEDSAFDEEPDDKSRLFPVEGGAMATAGLRTDMVDNSLLFVSGFGETQEAIDSLSAKKIQSVVEPLICPQGCLNGAGVKKAKGNLFERRAKLIAYAQGSVSNPALQETKDITAAIFEKKENGRRRDVTEEDIRHILEKTGKVRTEDQLNCGACGYLNCRDQAIAVMQGMAEPEMCIPYMRRLAEQRSDRIMATSPNGIIILNQELNVLNYNPAFASMFHTNTSCIGKTIGQFIDTDPFTQVASGQTEMFDNIITQPTLKLTIRLIVYALKAEKQYVGIFIAIPSGRVSAERLAKIKEETIQQARELYDHQIAMAKDFAVYLGEYTAKGEELVQKIVDAVKEDASTKKKEPS